MTEPTIGRPLDKCPYFHRTAVIMSDGQVVTCANFYAEDVGQLGADNTLSDLWRGDRLTQVRADFGTDKEWDQCTSCWFREIGYAAQRQAWHEDAPVSLDDPTTYTPRAWSFTRFLKGAE